MGDNLEFEGKIHRGFWSRIESLPEVPAAWSASWTLKTVAVDEENLKRVDTYMGMHNINDYKTKW